MVKTKIQHARQLGYCLSGVRQFCKKHGLDFADFARNGIDSDILKQTKDAMAIEMSKLAESEVGE